MNGTRGPGRLPASRQSAVRATSYRAPLDAFASGDGRGGHLGDAAQALRILGHPSRMAIAVLLLEGPAAVSAIESRLGLRQPNLSQHLGLLRDARLLTAVRHAKSVVYTLADGPQRELVTAIARIYRLGVAASPPSSTSPDSVEPVTPPPAFARAVGSSAAAHAALGDEADDASVFAHIVPGRRA